MPVTWSDEVDQILAGDLAAGFTYLTPAKGAVIAPMAPLGIRDRDAGTVTVTTSLALWKKLDRVRRNPGVAVAYHAREHGFSGRPGYVLVQGRASFDPQPDREYLESIGPEWDRFLVPRSGGLVGRLENVYYWERVAVNVAVERVIFHPDDRATERPEVFGAPLPAEPEPQKPPKNGIEPRQDVGKLAKWVDKLPHTLLAWCGSDDMPMVVPVTRAEESPDGARLTIPPGAAPRGGRRAGLTAHWFGPRMVGQDQRVYTGWMDVREGGSVVYSPHTKAGYRMPASKAAYTVGTIALATRMRAARKAGIAPPKS